MHLISLLYVQRTTCSKFLCHYFEIDAPQIGCEKSGFTLPHVPLVLHAEVSPLTLEADLEVLGPWGVEVAVTLVAWD